MPSLKLIVVAFCGLALSACGPSAPPPPSSAPTSATASAAACAPQPPAPAPKITFDGPPKPAMWKVADADTTVYLFGTVHLLPDTADWKTPALDKALGEAKAVYFEADVEIAPADMMAIVNKLGRPADGSTLSAMLTSAQKEKLACTSQRLGVPYVLLDAYLPWYDSVLLSNVVMVRAGFNPASGVEMKLRPLAESGGKEIRFLETVEGQLNALASLPNDVQVKFLMEGLDELDKAGPQLTELVKAWRGGEVDALNKLLNEEDAAEAIPEIHQALLVNRNANWAPQIDTLMDKEPGVFLVAVGSAHLVGPDSVIEKLKPLGHTAERVQ